MSQRSSKFGSVVAIAGLALLGGCGSQTIRSGESLSDIRSNPTPEISTLYQTPNDVSNRTTLTVDQNLSMFAQDFGRFWLYERPSRLTPEPVGH